MNISRFFPYKCLGIKFDLAIKWVKVKLIHHLCKPGTDHILNATYQVPRPLVFCSREEDIKGVLPYMGVVALTFETYL